jgi:hypothetical protein
MESREGGGGDLYLSLGQVVRLIALTISVYRPHASKDT